MAWKALEWWPGLRQLFRALEHSSGLWAVPSVSAPSALLWATGISSIFQDGNSWMRRLWSCLLLCSALSLAGVAAAAGGVDVVAPMASASGEAGGRFGSESCLLKRPHVPQAGPLALSLTGILIPASFISQVLTRVVEKTLYALQAEQC